MRFPSRAVEMLKPIPNKPSFSTGSLPEYPAFTAFSISSSVMPGPLSLTITAAVALSNDAGEGNSIAIRGSNVRGFSPR